MKIISILEIIVSLLLIIAILLQQRGSGLSGAIGGSSLYSTRRGIEKKIFWLTIVLTVIFLGLCLFDFFIS